MSRGSAHITNNTHAHTHVHTRVIHGLRCIHSMVYYHSINQIECVCGLCVFFSVCREIKQPTAFVVRTYILKNPVHTKNLASFRENIHPFPPTPRFPQKNDSYAAVKATKMVMTLRCEWIVSYFTSWPPGCVCVYVCSFSESHLMWSCALCVCVCSCAARVRVRNVHNNTWMVSMHKSSTRRACTY